MDDYDIYELFIEKYYIGIYSINKKLETGQMAFTYDIIQKFKYELRNISEEIRNILHMAYLLGIVESINESNNNLTFINLFRFYYEKVNKDNIPVEIKIFLYKEKNIYKYLN